MPGTVAHTWQDQVIGQMYYIERRKISLKYAFFRVQCLVFPRDIDRVRRYSSRD